MFSGNRLLRFLTFLILLFFIVHLGRSDSTSINIHSLSSTAPQRVATGEIAQIFVSFLYDADYPDSTSCSSDGEGQTAYISLDDMTVTIASAPTGAQTDLIVYSTYTGSDSIEYDTGSSAFFYFRSDTPGMYELTATISGLAYASYVSSSSMPTDSETLTISLEIFDVDSQTDHFIIADTFTISEFIENYEFISLYEIYAGQSYSYSDPSVPYEYENGFLVLSGVYIFDADTESTVTFNFAQEDSTDINSTYINAVIDDVSYKLPFYLHTTDETHLDYGPGVRIEDTDGDGIDEIFIETLNQISIINTEIGYLKLELVR